MNWSDSITLLAWVLTACHPEVAVHEEHVDVPYLIEAAELLSIGARPHIKIVDFRMPEDYAQEHIQNALNIWRSDVEDRSHAYGGMMASRAQIEELFGKLGIHTADTLVVYDDEGMLNAARLWWILQNYDHQKVRLLNGGIGAWRAAGGQLSSDVPVVHNSVFELPERSSMRYFVPKEEVQAALGSNGLILDTRSAEEFSGARHKEGAAKGGRIPGSIHIDWAEAVNYDGDQRLKTTAELEAIYSRMNISKDTPLIVYCHSGVRAAHTTFVLTQLLGYRNVKNYDGSWTEWSQYDDLPFEVDGTTQITP